MINQSSKKSIKTSKKQQNTAISCDSINQNPDAWLLSYEDTIQDLIRQKEAVQFVDHLMGNDEARNRCISDRAYIQSTELNNQINLEIKAMAQFQAYTMVGLQAKARILKAVTDPLAFDEGFISYEANMLLTSLLMDTLGGVKL